jgi:hypothetical protein
MNPRRYRGEPPHIVVGTAYYFASGIAQSRIQLTRLERAGKITPLFKLGGRRVQHKRVADRDIAKLIHEAEHTSAA